MTNLRHHLFKLLIVFNVAPLHAQNQPEPGAILKKLVPEISGIEIVPAEDFVFNPRGEYRRYAVIEGDFNSDGIDDIAICGIAWVQQGISKSRSGYVLIASKGKNGTWMRVFFHQFPGVSSPFILWTPRNRALVVGANQSDSDPGEIVWDKAKKIYRLVR